MATILPFRRSRADADLAAYDALAPELAEAAAFAARHPRWDPQEHPDGRTDATAEARKAAPVRPEIRACLAGEAPHPVARQMVAAAVRSWMEGDPLTAREQRIVETLLDTNYFGQLGRLAMGC